MRRIIRAAAILLAALLCACGIAEEAALYTENEWNYVDYAMDITGGIPEDATGVLMRIRETGVLRVATEPYFPPQEFIDPALEGQAAYVGADMALARWIAKRMDVTLEIVPMDFSRVLEAVAEGECDLAISALSYTPERAGRVTLSKGYYFTEDNAVTGLMIRQSDAAALTDVASLDGHDIAAQSRSLQEALMAEHMTGYRQFLRLPSMQAVYEALQTGAADAAAVNQETAQSYLQSNPDSGLTLMPGVGFELEPQFEGDRVAARQGEYMLIAFVNGVIDEVRASGDYDLWIQAAQRRAEALGM